MNVLLSLRVRAVLPALVVTLFLLCSCGRHPAPVGSPTVAPSSAPPTGTPPPPPPPPSPPRAAADGVTARNGGANENYAVVRGFYATDRQSTGDSAPGNFYGGDRQLDEACILARLMSASPANIAWDTFSRHR